MKSTFWQYERIGWEYGIRVPDAQIDAAKSRLAQRYAGSQIELKGDTRIILAQSDCADDEKAKFYLIGQRIVIDRSEGIEIFNDGPSGIEEIAKDLSLPLWDYIITKDTY